MRKRTVSDLLRSRLAGFPAAALVGARQCGKTTLARRFSTLYFDAEQPADRLRLDLQWDSIVAGRRLVVIDEAQTWPEFFPRLRAAIDADRRRNGRFLLLGSVAPALMREVSESLAGRLALVELTPFLLGELPRGASARLWLKGGFPDGGVLGGRGFPAWQRDYAALMAQRDLPAWGLPAKPQVTQRLMYMLAGVHGQIWNASNLGQSLGLSYHTINHYLDFLQGAYLLRRLSPWSARLGKRLVKSPKIYLRDSGLLHALLGIADEEALLRHPAAGASWEGYVIEQLLAGLAALGLEAESSFLRTSDGREIDLVLGIGAESIAIEIKLSSRPGPDDFASLDRAADLIDATQRYIVCRTAAPIVERGRGVLDLGTALDRLGHFAAPRARRVTARKPGSKSRS
ncbi:MAG: ATP-binding protein [Betaproteobacteria bacterium]|nr:ATP-binding protein [Betaproteobacteria bacterium]